ncbi:MAG TPA: glycerol-3-phosphate acyltransferase [Anaerolineales bacterium]|nr:glycerol-3-phosphate acyltransferase [Anaerolineales bacterium]
MVSIAMVFIAFLSGSFPFSFWLGKLFMKVDVRKYGDGNPGAANVFRSGNKIIGFLALILDICKAAAPVGIAYYNLGIRGIPMFLIAIAPILGHHFSPFLKFRGGKAIAASLGVWIGLTIWRASLVGVIGAVIGITLMTSSGWAVMLGLAMILIVLLFWMPDPLLLMVWVSETLILAWTHRHDLQQKPALRSWLTRSLTPKG